MRLRHIPDSASTLSTAFLASSKRIQDTWRKRIPTDKAFPAWGRWRAKRAGWGTSGMKKSEENRLKCVVCESTLSTADAVPLPQWGRRRGGGFAAKKGSQPRLAALGSPFQGKGLAWSLPPSYGRRCPEGAEVGWGKRHERERDCLKCTIIREHPSAANIYESMPEGLRRAGFPFTLF